jgi:hypothetical protein
MRMFGHKTSMRIGLIDLLFAIGCVTIGKELGDLVASALPAMFQPITGLVAGVCLYLVCLCPLYRCLRRFPMILPRCPCCASFQRKFQIIDARCPRIIFRCPSCNGEFVIWHNGKPGNQETWEKPVLALKWPYALGRYRRMQKP